MRKETLPPRLSIKELCRSGLLNNGDAPSCPNCKHYNALLIERTLEYPDAIFKCRDCGSLYVINMKGPV